MDSVASEGGDVESGRLAVSDPRLASFCKEADAIHKVLDWSRQTVVEVHHVFAAADLSTAPEHLSAADGKLTEVDERLAAMRARLQRIAGESKDFKRDNPYSTAVLRVRVVQYRQMCTRFVDVTKELESLRGRQRDALAQSVRRDLMRANPGVTAGEADEAMASGDTGLESAMLHEGDATAELRIQLQGVKERNADIGKLTKNMAELNTMFIDMGILVDSQQTLLNDIEYQEEEVIAQTKEAAEDLATAQIYQKAKNKKRNWCIAIVILFLLIAGIIAAKIAGAF